MSHSNTTQDTPRWIDDTTADIHEMYTAVRFPTRPQIASIIARHAPTIDREVSRATKELQGAMGSAYKKVANERDDLQDTIDAKDARIAELEAENERLRETLRRIEGKSWSGLYPEDGYENPKP